jgi:hypothetical protein
MRPRNGEQWCFEGQIALLALTPRCELRHMPRKFLFRHASFAPVNTRVQTPADPPAIWATG